MGADSHAYKPPKTDGTFALKVDWKRLAADKVKPLHDPTKLPHQLHPVTAEEFTTKTLKDWFNARQWRQSSLLESYSPKKIFDNYAHAHYHHKIPDRRIFAHWFLAVGAFAFVVHYGKNSAHTYAKNH